MNEVSATPRSLPILALRFLTKRYRKSLLAQWLREPRRIVHDLNAFKIRLTPWLLNRLNSHVYPQVSEAELRARRKSDTIFIFGSGASIGAISSDEWSHISKHDTLSFNHFIIQKFCPMSFHLLREVGLPLGDLDPKIWRPFLANYCAILKSNPHYQDTIIVAQAGLRALTGNRCVGLKLMPAGTRIFRYSNRWPYGAAPPTTTFSEGFVHAFGSLTDCVNFAAIVGWKRIVLVGIDMYDIRYFWQVPGLDIYPFEEITSGDPVAYGSMGDESVDISTATLDDPHRTARNGMVPLMEEWRKVLLSRGQSLEVYNPKSLLAEVMPVYATHQPGDGQ